jgi:uncharacterized protein
MADTPREKPSKMIVSLQMGGIFFALANIICVAIVSHAWLSVRLEPKTIAITGSAKRAIESDMITWSGTITARNPELTVAYDKLKGDADKVHAFLIAHGISEDQITFSAITTTKNYVKQVITQPQASGTQTNGEVVAQQGATGNAGPVVIQTDKISNYVLTQAVSIESKDMKRVPDVSRSVTSLIKDGVEIDSAAPGYLYTKLAELKIDMVAEATKDATNRATQIVTNANGTLGKLVEAKLGVMQINPKNTSATSYEGNNDTTSLEKEITAIVTARFELR